MNSAEQKMAKIYSFPATPRARSSAAQLARLEAEARLLAKTENGDCWYHDEAIAKSSTRVRH